MELVILSNWKRSLVSLAQNSLPRLVMTSKGTSNRQFHLSKMVEATVKDSLLRMATISAYVLKVLVLQRFYFFAVLGFEGSKQACLDSPLGLGTLGERHQQYGRFSWIKGSPDLTLITLLQVFLDVGVHARPVVVLANSFSSLGYPVLSGEHVMWATACAFGNRASKGSFAV